MFVALDMYFHIGFVSNMRKLSLIPLKELHNSLTLIKCIIKVNVFINLIEVNLEICPSIGH